MFGIKRTEESNLNNMMNQPNRKIVLQIDIDTGEILNTYPSASNASKVSGFNLSGICKCCNGEFKQFRNYMWQYS